MRPLLSSIEILNIWMSLSNDRNSGKRLAQWFSRKECICQLNSFHWSMNITWKAKMMIYNAIIESMVIYGVMQGSSTNMKEIDFKLLKWFSYGGLAIFWGQLYNVFCSYIHCLLMPSSWTRRCLFTVSAPFSNTAITYKLVTINISHPMMNFGCLCPSAKKTELQYGVHTWWMLRLYLKSVYTCY